MARAKFQTLTEQMFYTLLCLKEECYGMDILDRVPAMTNQRVNVGSGTLYTLLSFAEYAKDAQPEVLVTLIQTIIERIYIVDKDDERYCHIFIKGCSGEDYTGFFQTAGYIEDVSTSVCDSEQCCIRKK